MKTPRKTGAFFCFVARISRSLHRALIPESLAAFGDDVLLQPLRRGHFLRRRNLRDGLGWSRTGRHRGGRLTPQPVSAAGAAACWTGAGAGLAAIGLAFGIGTVRLATWAGRDGRGAAWTLSGAWAGGGLDAPGGPVE